MTALLRPADALGHEPNGAALEHEPGDDVRSAEIEARAAGKASVGHDERPVHAGRAGAEDEDDARQGGDEMSMADEGERANAALAFAFTVPGPPVPYQRAGRLGRRSYTPKRTADYREAIQYAVLGCIPRGWPVDARYSVTAEAHFATARRTDLDNVAKALCDAGNGAIWRDDSQVDRLEISRHLDRERPRLVVGVAVIGTGESHG